MIRISLSYLCYVSSKFIFSLLPKYISTNRMKKKKKKFFSSITMQVQVWIVKEKKEKYEGLYIFSGIFLLLLLVLPPPNIVVVVFVVVVVLVNYYYYHKFIFFYFCFITREKKLIN